MAMEKRWEAIPAISFSSDGTSEGQVTIATSIGFKAKQQVIIQAIGLPDLFLEVKRIPSLTTLLVGLPGNINARQDLSAYTVLAGATILAEDQPRSSIPEKELLRASFAEEPASAFRMLPVDQFGNPISPSNPLPVGIAGLAPANFGDVKVQYDSNNNAIKYSFFLKTELQGYITVSYDSNGNQTEYQGFDALGNPR